MRVSDAALSCAAAGLCGACAGRRIQALQLSCRNSIRARQHCSFGQALQIASEIQPREAGESAQIRNRAGQLVVTEVQIRQAGEGAHIRNRPGQLVVIEGEPGQADQCTHIQIERAQPVVTGVQILQAGERAQGTAACSLVGVSPLGMW